MSRMLQALKNLSTRPAEGPALSEPAAPAGQDPAAASPDPVLPTADHSRRMKELLVKHLVPPRPSELLRNLKAEMNGLGGMTVPIPQALRGAPPSAAFLLDAEDDLEPEPSMRESISVTFPMDGAGSAASPLVSAGPTSIDSLENLLATIEEEVESPGEEIAVSFGNAEAEERGQSSEVRGQEEARVPRSEFGVPETEAVEPKSPENLDSAALSHPHTLTPTPAIVADTPSSSRNPELGTRNSELGTSSVAASPLDHLADARPLVTYQPDEEEPPPAPAPLALPPRTITRSKTRLEQRVIDNLSNPSGSLPYRELADRLAQDLRMLSGRCLSFTGIGPASHADDILAHLASVMAEDDSEIVLVDADFTRGGLTVGFGALKEPGLGELLEHASRGEELVLPTLLPNISLLPAGRKTLPDTPGVIDQLAHLLAKLEERFALVLIDGGIHTGPLAASLARLCDATYFVVRLGATDARAANTALRAFRACGARVMGCVATKAG